VGTAIVWMPVAVGLALTGQLVRAGILLALGLGVIATVDNVLRPWLARLGRLQLPALVVFIAMMGGWRLIGGWGLILGPLLIRMGAEALSIASGRDSGTLFGSGAARGTAEDRAPIPGRRSSAPAAHGGQ
jgi:predicted PurR-regulated permease PerM